MSAKNNQYKFWQLLFAWDPAKCWEWPGAKDEWGYGKFHFDGQDWRTHRLAWVFAYGEIPDGIKVCHTCDNPACVNPSHLFLGTDAVNAADCCLKGRKPVRVDAAKVRQIRDLIENNVPQRMIAQALGIDQTYVSKVKTGAIRKWTV